MQAIFIFLFFFQFLLLRQMFPPAIMVTINTGQNIGYADEILALMKYKLRRLRYNYVNREKKSVAGHTC